MSFEFRAIMKILEDIDYRAQKEFTLEELAQYNGTNGKPVYVAIEGIVYDLSKKAAWATGTHFGLAAGKDLTEQFHSCHRNTNIINDAPKVGILVGNNNTKTQADGNRVEETYDFSPDDWVRYITPLVNSALEAANAGDNLEYLFQKYILTGILVGQGRSPEEAAHQVEQWQNSGMSQLLDKSKLNRYYHRVKYEE